ncbi:MAG: PqqD family protein [Porphyrobacter sp.]|nr:PqqD family protein [Porphyrobacter sp.]
MSTEHKFMASEDVVAREVGGEMVLLDLSSGLYFGLDPVGSCVWERLSESGASLAELTDIIEASFDAPREVIATDLERLMGQLTEKKLVETASA